MEEMVHRNPGDPSTLSAVEQTFSVARAWVAAELEGGSGADGAQGGGGFTRVVIGDLKPDVLRQIMEDERGGQQYICQVGGQWLLRGWSGSAGTTAPRVCCRPSP